MTELNQTVQASDLPKIKKAFLINNQVVGLGLDDSLVPLADLTSVAGAPRRRRKVATAATNGVATPAKKRGRPAKTETEAPEAASSESVAP